MKPVTVEIEGRSYTWNGKKWFDSRTYQSPPTALASKLNEHLTTPLAVDDFKVTDFQGLLRIAQSAREAAQYKRAEVAIRRALALEPSSEAALAILCSVLRQLGASDRAVQETQHVRFPRYQPLLVSRAAALCDLEQWEEAKATVGQALAIGPSQLAFEVVQRIKAHRPDLYEGADRR